MDKKYDEFIKEKDYDSQDRLYEKLEDVLQWVYNHTINLYLDRKEQKVKIKLHPYDTWNLDSTLALIILPLLKQLKEVNHGAPNVDDIDVPDELKSTSAPTKENDYDVDDNHFKRWDWVMDEMIWSFEQLNIDWEAQYHSGTCDFKSVGIDLNGNEVPKEDADLFRLDRGPKDTHKFDKEGYSQHSSRIDRGLVLFGKYYRGLWD